MSSLEAVIASVGITASIKATSPLTESVIRVDFNSRPSVVAKRGHRDLIEAEGDGLDALREQATLDVPDVIGVAPDGEMATLVTGWVGGGVPTGAAWSKWGKALARHHGRRSDQQYGWRTDNFIGVTPQQNVWCDDWVKFNRRSRLGPQLALAMSRHVLEPAQISTIEQLLESLEVVLDPSPHPAVLHGDLWSGNIVADHSGRLHVIDPAVSVGDRWADIAMLRLFGGVPAEMEAAYCAEVGSQPPEGAIAAYQCYHLLNHVNIFGSGYAQAAVAAAQRATSAVGGRK